MKKNSGLTFNREQLNQFFPFYLLLNKDLSIEDSGASMRKIFPDIHEKRFNSLFNRLGDRDTGQMEWDDLIAFQGIQCLLESSVNNQELRFLGQISVFEGTLALLVATPILSEVKELKEFNLVSSDFASHENMRENLKFLSDIEQTNEKLRQKKETIQELSMFPEQNPTPIVRVDFEGNILYQNSAARMTLNETILADQKFWLRMYMKMQANHYERFTHDIKFENQLFEVTLVPITEKKYFNVYFREITEMVRYQNELITTNTRLNSLLNSMQSAVLAEDDKGLILHVNPRFCQFFEITEKPEDLKERSNTELHEKILSSVKNSVEEGQQMLELCNSRIERYGDLMKMKNGKIFERDFIPIIENGAYIGHIWKFQDVSELFFQRENLIRIEEKYRRIIEDLEFGLVEVDLNEVITKVYPAFCKLTGYSESELVGRNARELLAFHETNELLDIQNEFRRNGESSVYEIQMKTKNDVPKWVIISGTPIYNEYDEIVGSIGIHLDISERKKLEEDLVKANEQAHSSIRAKELFIANMSHELRTPMNVIMGMADLFSQNDLDSEQKKYLDAIKHSADNLLSLINDLLDFSKIEAGYISIDPQPTEINEVLNLVAISFKDQCLEKGVMFELKTDEAIHPRLSIDAYKLNQVFMNLVGNAVKFTQKGFVEISASVLKDEPSQQTIRFKVKDSGIGIEEKNFDLIFQSFRQEDDSISRNFGGTGLGLSITKRIIEAMDGYIFVESEKGKGTVFWFDLALEKCSQEEETVKTDITALVESLRTLRILVAEDNPLNQMLIQTVFSKDRIPILLVQNGYEVLEAARTNVFDVMLMDIQMPKMDGETAVQKLRAMGIQTPVIALTANVSDEEIDRYLQNGMVDHVPKPFKKEDLYLTISTVLNLGNPALNNDQKKVTYAPVSYYSLDKIREIAGGDTAFIASIQETFIGNTPKYLTEIESGLTEKNQDKIRIAAHQLKPSIDLLGIVSAQTDIRYLEEEGKKEKPDWLNAEASFDRVRYIIHNVLEDMRINVTQDAQK